MLVTSGANIHPSEVESMLAGCPGLHEAAVTGLPDPVWGQRLIALYTGEAEPADVERWTKETIIRPMRPHEFYKLQELPRNALGKLKRADLPALIPSS
jgi:O-succinylbenzoic acid--CoA ligase